jgi:HK97 family phage major capsid protein
MPADGVAGNNPVLLGNMSGYLIAARSLITLRLDERFADTDGLRVILADRVGGAVHNVDAFRAGVV